MLSINSRVLACAFFIVVSFIIATGLILDGAFYDSARSARQERLLGQIYLIIAAAEVNNDGSIVMPSALSEPRFDLPNSGLYAAILNSEGIPVWRSLSSAGIDVPLHRTVDSGKQFFRQQQNAVGESFFIYSLGISWSAGSKQHQFTVAVSEDLIPFNNQMNIYRKNLWTWLGVMSLLLLVALVIVLRWGLNPLRQVARDLSAIELGKQQQLEGNYPRELKRLTDNINGLLVHERDQQQRYRNALADLAHSLKTPLAVIQGSLSNDTHLISSAANSVINEQIVQMDRIIQYQLQRAAAVGRKTALASFIDIAPIANKIINSLQKVYREKSIHIATYIDMGIGFKGDEGDLTEVLGNILENACKWCKSNVKLTVKDTKSKLVILVEDDGPGISGDKANIVLQRGVRMDESVAGHGIGLAIVHDIVKAYGGDIKIDKSSTLAGAGVIISFIQ